MKTIDTWLPLFPGFYCTIFEPVEDYEIEDINSKRDINNLIGLVDYDLLEWDYEDYKNSVGSLCCEFVEGELEGFVKGINFQRINSPKYYNFSNDSIYCSIELTGDNIDKIKSYINDNMDAFSKFIRERYTSCDGFISHYSNDSREYLANFTALEDIHKLGSILEFILLNENDEDEILDMMYEFTLGNCNPPYAINYEQATICHICSACGQFMDKELNLNAYKQADKYRKITGRVSAGIRCIDCVEIRNLTSVNRV